MEISQPIELPFPREQRFPLLCIGFFSSLPQQGRDSFRNDCPKFFRFGLRFSRLRAALLPKTLGLAPSSPAKMHDMFLVLESESWPCRGNRFLGFSASRKAQLFVCWCFWFVFSDFCVEFWAFRIFGLNFVDFLFFGSLLDGFWVGFLKGLWVANVIG